MTEETIILDDGAEMTNKQAAEFVETIEKVAAERVATMENGEGENIACDPSGILTPEQFEQHFFELFDIVGDLWDMPEFKVQRDKPFEVAGAKVSAKKLYLMAQKYKMLHFLIEPCGGWFGDTIAIACFAGAKANVACKRFTGNGLTGYVRKFMKKSGEQVKKNRFMSRFFNKGEENDKAADIEHGLNNQDGGCCTCTDRIKTAASH